MSEGIKKRVDYLRKSMRLDNPSLISDPAYVFSDEDLLDILEVSAPIFNGGTFQTLKDENFYFVLLLAKREIYYRLATTTAPFYPLAAEGAELKKNIRFDHYIKLVETVTEEYEKAYERAFGKSGGEGFEGEGIVSSHTVGVRGKGYANRTINQLIETPNVIVTIDNVGKDFVEISWEREKDIIHTSFYQIKVFVSRHKIHDEYALDDSIKIPPYAVIENPRRDKLRIEGLKPGAVYYIAVSLEVENGIVGVSQDVLVTKESNEEVNIL